MNEFIAMIIGMITGAILLAVVAAILQNDLECVQGIITDGKAVCVVYVDKTIMP